MHLLSRGEGVTLGGPHSGTPTSLYACLQCRLSAQLSQGLRGLFWAIVGHSSKHQITRREILEILRMR